jgi:GH24 family phage-related lysozyme (muramidase)
MPPWVVALGVASPFIAAWLAKKYGVNIPQDIQQIVDPQTGAVVSFDANNPSIVQQAMYYTMTLSVSQNGLDFIRKTETLSLTPYQDGAGYWTIGYGHKIQAGEPYYPMGSVTSISVDDAESLFEQDVGKAVSCVQSAVTVPLGQAQFDALVSFTFNVGCHKLTNGGAGGGPSTLLADLNAGDYAGAASQFQRWVYAGGRVEEGLVTRRLAEAATFSSGASG